MFQYRLGVVYALLAVSVLVVGVALHLPVPSLLFKASMGSQIRAPSYFISHGGPPTMFETGHAAYRHWQQWGREVRDLHRAGRIRGLVFVSAHWQAEQLPEGVYVNINRTNPLVYDFYNFPGHFYTQKLSSQNTPELSSLVTSHLDSKGVKVVKIDRGLDHGVWCPLKVAFQLPYIEDIEPGQKLSDPLTSTSRLPDTLPLVQISLPRSESFVDSLKLGKALRGLRDQGYAIVGGGMSVHNLRDFMVAMRGANGVPQTNYSRSFLAALTEAMTIPAVPGSSDEERWAKALQLAKRPDFIQSHPTPEHFLRKSLSFQMSQATPADLSRFATQLC